MEKEFELEQDKLELDSLELGSQEDIDNPIKREGNTTIIDQNGQELLLVELPSGLKVQLGSNKLLVNELCGLALTMIKELDVKKQNGTGSYLG